MNPISTLNTITSMIGGNGNGVGWTNFGSLSPHHFATITETNGGDMVIGRIISYSISNENNWENTFEGMDEDSKNPFMAGIIQSGDLANTMGWEALQKLQGKTLVTEAQSVQIWRGIQPQSISLELEFKAFSSAYSEVELPIQYLTRMQAPRLSTSKVEALAKTKDDVIALKNAKNEAERSTILGKLKGVLGDVPSFVTVDFLGKRFEVDYVIESVSEDVDAVRVDADGNRIRQVVNLTLGSKSGVVKDKIKVNDAVSVLKQFTTITHELQTIF